MKNAASTITNKLRAAGIPIAKLDGRRGIRVSGVSVSATGGILGFEWMNWANDTDRVAESAKVVAAIEAMGLRAVPVVVGANATGFYRIGR